MKRTLPLFFLLVTCSVVIAQNVTIQKILPGTLGKEILRQVDNLSDVESLTIQGGTLNDADFTILYSSLRKVRHLDLYGITNTYFPSISNCEGFRRCDSLRTVRLPKDLDRLGSSYIADNSNRPFEYCAYLESIEIPAGVRQLPIYSFNKCKRLREVILNEGLEFIGKYAFNSDSLRIVTLPCTLVQADAAFNGCDNLYEVISLATTPPLLKERDLFGYDLSKSDDVCSPVPEAATTS